MPAQITVEYLESHAKLHDGQERFWVDTRDLSTRGISFYHRAMMYYGERVRLELRAQGGELRCLEAQVVRCRRRLDGRFEVGAVFEESDKMPPAEPKFAMPDGADE